MLQPDVEQVNSFSVSAIIEPEILAASFFQINYKIPGLHGPTDRIIFNDYCQWGPPRPVGHECTMNARAVLLP